MSESVRHLVFGHGCGGRRCRSGCWWCRRGRGAAAILGDVAAAIGLLEGRLNIVFQALRATSVVLGGSAASANQCRADDIGVSVSSDLAGFWTGVLALALFLPQ